MATGNGSPPYAVSTPPHVRERFKPWAEVAARLGLLREYIADLKRLDAQLTFAPRTWGDPLNDFPHARLRYYRGMTEYLVVLYAVHLDQRVVFVRDVTLRHDRALGRAESAE